jgi:hypothetical protein
LVSCRAAIRHARGSNSSIFGLLVVALLVGTNVVLDLLVLLEKEPKHSIQFLGRLDLHLGVAADGA